MFNNRSRFTLTVIGFDKKNKVLPFCIGLPIDESEKDSFTVPSDVDYISLFQYYEDGTNSYAEKAFYVHTGEECLGEEALDLDENGHIGKNYGGFSKNFVGEETLSNFSETRYCCKIDPNTGKRVLRAKLEGNDLVVPEGELTDIILEISNIFEDFNKSLTAMKTLGNSQNKTAKKNVLKPSYCHRKYDGENKLYNL